MDTSFGTKCCPNKKKYYGTCTVNRSQSLKNKFSSWEKMEGLENALFSLYSSSVCLE